jgi:tight adherence protein C
LYYPQAVLVGFITFAGVLLFSLLTVNSRTIVRQRLLAIARVRGVKTVIDAEDMCLPFRDRVLKPALETCGKRIARLAPLAVHINVRQRLIQAGHPGKLQTNGFLAITAISTLILPVLALTAGWVFGLPVRSIAGLTLLSVLSGLFIPWFWLSRKATERIHEVDLALPDAIDLLVVSIEAGLAMDMALAKVTEKMQGPLPDEFARTLNEIRLGKRRRQALKDLGNRVGSKSLSTFLNTVVQGTQMGVSLGSMLRIQSERVRQERRQRAEETAMKAPIKMLFPMVCFIFPALFVVLLGPAVIRIIQAFQNM